MSRLGFDRADVLLPRIQWVHAARGEVLFEEGQPGRSLYLILRGRVRVVNGRDRLDERTVAVLGSGELIGELSLLTGQPRLASVQMLRDTELACISAEVFQAALAQNPHLMWPLTKVLAHRLRTVGPDR